jgi:hypothetical protein
MVLLYQIAHDLPLEEGTAKRSIFCLALFPTAFYLFGIFPQSLALLWILLAYQQAQRGHWLAASLAGLLAGLTHSTVVPLVILLAVQSIQALHGNRFSIRWPALLSVPFFPLLGIAIFLAWRVWMGYPSMVTVQIQNWGHYFSPPWKTLLTLTNYLLANGISNWVVVFNTILLGLSIYFAIWGLRYLPFSLNLYQISLLIFLLSTPQGINDPLVSFNRYILLQFPMILGIGSFRLGHYTRLVLFAFSLLISLWVSAMFFMWKWVG